MHGNTESIAQAVGRALGPKAKVVRAAEAGPAHLEGVDLLVVGSPTYGRFATFPLSAERPTILVIPPGLAHGFCVTGDHALLLYKVTTAYAPDHDTGIRWDSAGIPWPVTEPVISARDRGFVSLAEFASPFRYREEDR